MVFETVRRARHRILANEAMRHAAYSVSAALASLILLLLLGTQILSWAWLLLLPAIALAAGVYVAWGSAPSAYQVAQRIDHHLKLADTLSTALFFAGHDRDGGMRRAQWSQAERIAAGVDPRRAIPIHMPRALYATGLLALAAGSLFALRYGLDRRLDLRAPLARIVQDKLGYTEARQAARDRRNPAAHDPKRPEETGFSLDEAGQKGPGELDAAPDSALDTVGVPDVDNKTGSSRPQDSKLAQSKQIEGEQNQSEEPEGVSANPGDQQSADGRKGPSAGKPGKQGQGDDKQAAGNPSENSGLLGKFRDAMSSLMNRMRQQAGAKGAQQQAGAQNGGQQQSQSGKQGQQRGDGQQADAKDAQGPSAGKPGKQGQGDDKQAAGNPSENSGLLGVFRDAMSSLMNRMRQQAGAKGAQQQAGAQNGGQQKSQSGKQGQQPGDGQQADAKDAQPGDDSENAQSAQSGSPG